MEKIDFYSWCENIEGSKRIKADSKTTLESKFDQQAFEDYQTSVKAAKEICNKFINDSLYEKVLDNDGLDQIQYTKSLIHYLFKAKLDRLDARRTFNPKVERNKYIEASNKLNTAFNRIPITNLKCSLNGQRSKDYDLLIVLFYNDLSICYAGFKNSSMSRGFAEEAIKILEEDSDFIKFRKSISNVESKIVKNTVTEQDFKKLQTLPFVSGKNKKYDLYTFALFCRGIAEFRSFLKDAAERTFITIINFSDRYKCPRNSDYYSSLVQFASLLNDLSRSKEAIKVLENLENGLEKTDRRYTEGLLEKASSLIDQGSYVEGRKTLEIIQDFSKLGEIRYTEQILNGLIYYGRSFLEQARNILPVKELSENKKTLLKKAEEYLKEACKRSEKRKQKNLIQKAAKYLAELHYVTGEKQKSLDYYAISISEGENNVKSFPDLLKAKKLDFYVSNCDDIDILENFSQQIFDSLSVECKTKRSPETILCLNLLNKLKEECPKKEKLWLCERAERKKEEIEFGRDCDNPKTLANETDFQKSYEILTGQKTAHGKNFLNDRQIKARLDSNEISFDKILYGRTDKATKDSAVELIVLRRWNSFSPGLSRKYAISLGGGYLLRIWAPKFKEKMVDNLAGEQNSDKWFNVVIDPGYNFLLNFHNEDFHIEDIDAVIVSHSHPDHCAELSAIMDLMSQINKRQKDCKNKKKIFLLLSRGAYKKFLPYIQDWKEQLKDVLILEDNTIWPEKDDTFEFQAINTAHADLGGERAVGIIARIKMERELTIGFIGDTPWREYVREAFRNCDILALHIGGIKYYEIGFDNNKKLEFESCYKTIRKKVKEANHLLFYGSQDIIDNCKPDSIIIISEFGEELKYGLRTDIVDKLNFWQHPLCVPGDIGFYFVVTKDSTKIVRCDFCGAFIRPEDIKIFHYGLMDSLHYVCDTCDCTLTESQKRTIVDYKLTKH